MPDIRTDIVDCYAFRRQGDRAEFLQLQRRPDSYLGGTWHPVAGRVEAGETAWQAALRELEEEAGLRPLRFWQLQHVHRFYMAAGDAIVFGPCFAAEVAARATVRLSAEHVAWRWVDAADVAASFLWPGQVAAVDEVLKVILAGAPAEAFLRIDPSRPPGAR